MHPLLAFVALIVASVLAFGVDTPAQAPKPLPATEPFYEAVRANLARSQQEQNRFAYKERRTELRKNPFGRIGTGVTRVYDVTPRPDGMTVTRRLIEDDGKPVVTAPAERREPIEQRSRASTGRALDDIVQTLQFVVDRREMLDGRPMIVVNFVARPDAKPRTSQGRIARAFKGSIWVDETAEEVKKVEATAVDDLSVGFGVVARLNEGARVSAKREPVTANLWLPTSIRFVGDGRALLFRKLNLDYAIEWFDYKEVR